jgi:flagellar hook-associated protein 3 FlgL
MRVSTHNAFDRGLSTLQQRQIDLMQMQEQLTSGKRVTRSSDDPTAAARAERALATQMRSASDQRALDASRNAMTQAESALGDAGDLLQKARDQIMAAGNATYGDAERQGLAVVLRGLRTQLISVANRGDGAGSYLFGGQGAQRPPFVDAPGGVQYRGAGGESQAAMQEAMPLTLDGRHTWLAAVDPVGGEPDLSVFDVLDRVATELDTPGRTKDQIAQSVTDGLRDLDAVAGHLLSQRARVGELLTRGDSVEVRLSQQALSAQAERSAAEDLDMVQAVSAFQSKQTGYDAALQAYAKVQRMSLFDYIKG